MKTLQGKIIQVAVSETASDDKHTGSLVVLTDKGEVYIADINEARTSDFPFLRVSKLAKRGSK